VLSAGELIGALWGLDTKRSRTRTTEPADFPAVRMRKRGHRRRRRFTADHLRLTACFYGGLIGGRLSASRLST
jgi:hypothetical protein